MPNYQRPGIAGETYFITQVTYQRQPLLCRDMDRTRIKLKKLMHQISCATPLKERGAIALLSSTKIIEGSQPCQVNSLNNRKLLV